MTCDAYGPRPPIPPPILIRPANWGGSERAIASDWTDEGGRARRRERSFLPPRPQPPQMQSGGGERRLEPRLRRPPIASPARVGDEERAPERSPARRRCAAHAARPSGWGVRPGDEPAVYDHAAHWWNRPTDWGRPHGRHGRSGSRCAAPRDERDWPSTAYWSIPAGRSRPGRYRCGRSDQRQRSGGSAAQQPRRAAVAHIDQLDRWQPVAGGGRGRRRVEHRAIGHGRRRGPPLSIAGRSQA